MEFESPDSRGMEAETDRRGRSERRVRETGGGKLINGGRVCAGMCVRVSHV